MGKLRKLYWLVIPLAVIFVLALVLSIWQKTTAQNPLHNQTFALIPQQSITLNKTFSFPVKNAQGQEVTTIAYTILSVDKQNQVIVKGQKANAVDGRTFLVISMKLTNASSQPIELNSRDYIRVSVGKSSERLAADLYNDPILVQPISTEYTKLGFPIDASEKLIVLHVGELNGSKTTIPVNFK